ncbi:hypothetical protein J4573_52185 [Actinomadura barringtoniae]|uniref:Secreted protein n=1 Tax=Actinomadura barringtoniae TaxID=1427535 RepID=A0A939PNQ7_9ACTN|nr:hypothetical protein [Actinomadura barringtoniae]MBO2455717.1 hypothetical protein [Actinomadura barringtoniae]
MRFTTKKAPAALAAALLATSFIGALGFQGQAAAADRCSGTLVEEQRLTGGGKTLAYLNLYWDGHYNCAELVSSSTTSGTLKAMGVYIYTYPLSCKNGGCGIGSYTASAGEYSGFRYYAGPKRLDGRNKCVRAYGVIDWPATGDSREYNVSTKPAIGHC